MEHTEDLIDNRVLIAVAHTSVEIQSDILQEKEVEHTEDPIGKQDLADRVLIAVAQTSVEIKSDTLQDLANRVLISHQQEGHFYLHQKRKINIIGNFVQQLTILEDADHTTFNHVEALNKSGQDILDRDMEGEDVLDSISENLLEHIIGSDKLLVYVELIEDGNNTEEESDIEIFCEDKRITSIKHVPPNITENSVPEEALEVIDAEGKDSEHFCK